ncbi:MAG: preprotein translocase subunit YajC, partial [Bacteroidaceae bacterium]
GIDFRECHAAAGHKFLLVKQIENFRKGLGVGNQVVTAGGIHGVIREVNNANNTVVLEIDKNVKITIEKSSIYANAGSVAEAQQSK